MRVEVHLDELLGGETTGSELVLQVIDRGLDDLELVTRRMLLVLVFLGGFLGGEREGEQCERDDGEGESLHADLRAQVVGDDDRTALADGLCDTEREGSSRRRRKSS